MEQKIDKKKNKADFNLVKENEILPTPNRTLPKLIEELLEKNIPIILSKDGYYVGGFYGLGEGEKKGFVFAKDTTEANTLAFIDNKGNFYSIKNFEELVKYNNHIWAAFYKLSDDYKKPNSLWFSYLLEYNVLNITPR